MLSKKLAALAALSMLTVSTASVAQSAAAPTAASSSAVRASAVVEDASELEGRKTWLWIALAAAIVLAIILISDGGDSRSP